MHRYVEVLIGRLATDPGLRRRFTERPLEVIRDLGLEFSEVELEALAGMDTDALRIFSASLDPRIRKVLFEPQRQSAEGDNNDRTEGPTEKETSS